MPSLCKTSHFCIRRLAFVLAITVLPVAGWAQALVTLHSFAQGNGVTPLGSIVRDSAGNIYGETEYGEGNSYYYGEIYKISADGTFSIPHQFCSEPNCADGANPWGGLIMGSDGNIWGTTLGTVFKMSLAGDLTTVYTFCSLPGCADGDETYAPLVEGPDGNFYGVTLLGGLYRFNECGGTCGVVFQVTPAGVLTVLHSFNGHDGYYPIYGLVLGSDGNYYGTTTRGGMNGLGTAFKISSAGAFTLLHNFSQDEGYYTLLTLQAASGNFYGISLYDGADSGGTAFEMTPGGKVTVIRNFDSSTGTVPLALIPGPKGNFFGALSAGGNGGGLIFEMNPSGNIKTLYEFCSLTNCDDGQSPNALLTTASGTLIGTTASGGGNSCDIVGAEGACGAVFSFEP